MKKPPRLRRRKSRATSLKLERFFHMRADASGRRFAFASLKRADHSQGSDGGKEQEKRFKKALRDDANEPASGKDTKRDGGNEEEIEEQRCPVDEAELHAERDFENIDDEEKPRAGADERIFGHVG